MKLVENIYEEYKYAVSKRRKLSNCYFSSKQLLDWNDNGNIIAYSDSKNLIISVQEVGYRKMYFLAETWECLEKIFEIDLGKGEKAFEIICQGESGEYDLSKKIQCKEILDYIRLRATNIHEIKVDLKKIDYCHKGDISRLNMIINNTFDPVGAYLPTDKELLSLIENKTIICYRNIHEEVIGFLIFEDKGKTTYIRMLCIAENSRGEGLGRDLLVSYLNLHKDFKNFTIWCRADNTIALKLYTEVGGYHCENFHNYVFVL